MKQASILILLLIFSFSSLFAQLFGIENQITKADTLRGALSPERTCYDQTFNHLDVKFDFANKSISGSNTIFFTVVNDFSKLQIDLFENMKLEKILDNKGNELKFSREFGAVFVYFPNQQYKGEQASIQIFYNGTPIAAKRAPWDGGFVWKKDKNENDFVGVACQGTGASLWWPCKDHQADEVDSMLLTFTSPSKYTMVANGKLRSKTKADENNTTTNWIITYPINSYNVTFNIGDFVNFSETMPNNLLLDYYVLSYNLEKAKEHFKQVKPMMECFTKFFGDYPFKRDSYKLVETSYLGMEHQSAVAYGNNYLQGYLGTDRSGTGIGKLFDYIIIHETGHEWWGNNVTSKDIADMWIHEGFCTYSESIYVECLYGKDSAISYLNGGKNFIENKSPIIGKYNLNLEGSGDMYPKGSLFLNTVRSVINNDVVWFSILKGIQKDFALKTTTTEEIINYMSSKSGKDLSKMADQYLNYPDLPELELKTSGKNVEYRWNTNVKNFEMPVRLMTKGKVYQTITPTNNWQLLKINGKKNDLQVDEDHFYVKTKRIN